MCMIEDGEPAQVYREKIVKGRKEHKCEECGRPIAIGEQHRYIFILYEFEPSQARICRHCLVGCSWLVENCGGYVIGSVWDDIDEHAGEYPRLRIPLRRLKLGADRKWQNLRRDGLLAEPKLPPSIQSVTGN